MQIPKHVISVWPKKLGGISDAVVKLTIGGAISIFPVKLAKGKGGLHLCLPKTDTVTAAASGANTNSPICTVTAAQSKLILNGT